MYKCIFDKSKDCPVRAEYKLAPESLAKFCGPCRNHSEYDEILPWFHFVINRGYIGTLTDFLKESTQNYFREHNIDFVTVKTAVESGIDEAGETSFAERLFSNSKKVQKIIGSLSDKDLKLEEMKQNDEVNRKEPEPEAISLNYRSRMDVIRYYHIFKNNGFLGDFSDFINGIVLAHFVKCHGVILPVTLQSIAEVIKAGVEAEKGESQEQVQLTKNSSDKHPNRKKQQRAISNEESKKREEEKEPKKNKKQA